MKNNDRQGRDFSLVKTRSFYALSALIQSALIAALYLALTVATSFMSFQVVQLRLAEALTALPALFPSAVLGVFAGCLLSNLLNPSPLGIVDVIAGSATTLIAAYLTWVLGNPLRQALARRLREVNASEVVESDSVKRNRVLTRKKIISLKVYALLPPVVLNALVVGFYIPFLISEDTPGFWLIVGTMGSICLSQAFVVYGLGLPLIKALELTPWAKRIYLVDR
jgi:hypothetical protein